MKKIRVSLKDNNYIDIGLVDNNCLVYFTLNEEVLGFLTNDYDTWFIQYTSDITEERGNGSLLDVMNIVLSKYPQAEFFVK